MERRINVRGIIVYEDKLLCVRLTNYREEKAPDYWCVPGGGLDINESILTALNRELIEELGVKPKIGKLLYIHQYKDSKCEQLELFFHIENPEDYLDIDLKKATHGIDEIEKVEFIDPATNNILPKFLTTEAIDINQTVVKFYSYI